MGLSTQPRKRPIRWAAAAYGASAVILGASLLYAVYNARKRLAAFHPVARSLPIELASAKAEGLPLAPDDLRRKPPVPRAENAAPLYRRIHDLYRRLPKSAKDSDDDLHTAMRRAARTAVDRANAKAMLTDRAEIIRLAKAGAKLPHCDFERPY